MPTPRAPGHVDITHCSICLDCIVTVVDARHIRRQLADPRPDGGVNEAQQQVAFADVVLLNKVRSAAGSPGVACAAAAALDGQCGGLQGIPRCSECAALTASDQQGAEALRPLHTLCCRRTLRTSSSCWTLRAGSGE